MQNSKSVHVLLQCFFAFVVALCALSLVAPLNPEPLNGYANPKLLPTIVTLQPVPRNRFMYLAFALLIASMLPLVYGISRLRRLEGVPHLESFLGLFAFSIVIVISVGVPVDAMGVLADSRTLGLSAVLCGVTCFAISKYPTSSRALIILLAACATIALSAVLRIWTAQNVDYSTWFVSHGEAVLYSITNIALGATCLGDALPQYGCNGEYMAPVLKFFGVSILNIMLVMLALQVVALLSVIWYCTKLIKTTAVLLSCLLMVLFFCGLNMQPTNPDPILQFYPIRFLFPALSLPIVVLLQNRRTRAIVLFAGLFSGVAITWNLESGLITAIALAAFVVAGGFSHNDVAAFVRERLFQLALYAVSLSVYLLIFALYLYAKSDVGIVPTRYFAYQEAFYFMGYGMIPLPAFPAYWSIPVIITFTCVAGAGMMLAIAGRMDLRRERATYLTILAIGFGLYYSGRSHDYVLKLASWPTVIVFFHLLDEAVFNARQRRLALPLITSIQFVVLMLSMASIIHYMPAVWKQVRVSRAAAGQSNELQQDALFIKRNSSPRERVLIFALHQSTLYTESATVPALGGPGVAELILRSDLEALHRQIFERKPDKLFIGANLDKASDNLVLGANLKLDMRSIEAMYRLQEVGPGGRVYYYRFREAEGRAVSPDAIGAGRQ